MSNLQQNDDFYEARKRLTNWKINGCNNERVNGAATKKGLTGAAVGNAMLNSLTGSPAATNAMKDAINNVKRLIK